MKEANVEILETAIQAVEKVCPKLQFWNLQTGGGVYGFDLADKVGLPKTPCKESSPRIPEPFASQNMYYAQYDALAQLAEGKAWTFAEVRPDSLVGFVPNHNAMNIAQALALFLSFYAFREGQGARVPYPGPAAVFTSRHTDVSQDRLARFHIFVSLHPDRTSTQAFNVGDEDQGSTWAKKWPVLASYFGLVGTGPVEGAVSGVEYVMAHKAEWAGFIAQTGIKEDSFEKTGWNFMWLILGMPVFDREYDLSRSREIGWVEEEDSAQGYLEAFRRMREAKIIP